MLLMLSVTDNILLFLINVVGRNCYLWSGNINSGHKQESRGVGRSEGKQGMHAHCPCDVTISFTCDLVQPHQKPLLAFCLGGIAPRNSAMAILWEQCPWEL